MEQTNLSSYNEKINREAPQLVTLLKDLKTGLDDLRTKVQVLTSKVKADHYPTSDGISYLEAKHLLLLNYCQSLVYYLLRKAKGISIEGHPVVQSLVETRLFLEKIRPIDKKLQYQIQKLTRLTGSTMEKVGSDEKEPHATRETEDPLKYRPNPDNLVPKYDMASQDVGGKYQPPKFLPTSMEEDNISKQEKNTSRKEKETYRKAMRSAYMRELMNDLEGRPDELREIVGTESREITKYKEKLEDRARREEDLFIRAPLTKAEKQKMKHMKKSRNGLLGLTESFYDEIKTLPLEDSAGGQTTAFTDGDSGERKFKKRKGRH